MQMLAACNAHSIGTLFHFADCEDRLGKTATAWAAFREVEAEAKALGQTARVTAAQATRSARYLGKIIPHEGAPA